MSKYMLIEVEERHISPPMFFDTLKEAQDSMKRLFAKALGMDVNDIAAWLEGEDESDTKIDNTYAFCEHLGNNFDWQIFEITPSFMVNQV